MTVDTEERRIALDYVNGNEVSTVRLSSPDDLGDHETLVNGSQQFKVWGRQEAIDQHYFIVAVLMAAKQ